MNIYAMRTRGAVYKYKDTFYRCTRQYLLAYSGLSL
jgi:hypothetical protein